MMKFVVICALIGFAAAGSFRAPSYKSSSDDAHAEITQQRSDVNEHGFNYLVETSNGIRAEASGNEAGTSGVYSYYSPEGQLIQVSYVADANGYQPSSDVLPTPPPIPAAILRSLEYIRTHPAHDDYTGKQQQQRPFGRHF